MDNNSDRILSELAGKSPVYSEDAYRFVADTVTWMAKKRAEKRHVSAAELVDGAALFAAERYGALAKAVLDSFGIVRADDVGEIVYQLIGVGILCASEDDRREDFEIDRDVIPELPAELLDKPVRFEKACF